MANFKLTPKEIYETDFEIKLRGYDKEQVDEMLDSVIVDYEAYQTELLRLQEENEFLKKRVAELESGAPVVQEMPQGNYANEQPRRFDPFSQKGRTAQQPVNAAASPTLSNSQVKEPSNFDLLKRINRLERAVFGPGSMVGDTSDLRR
ncbi:MAG: DivIVA domain-containing protein [Lactovum sp.]